MVDKIVFGNWQRFLDDSTQDISANKEIQDNLKSPSDVERFHKISNFDILKNVPWIEEYFSKKKEGCQEAKSDSKANEFRQKGNTSFVKKENSEALLYYNQCICHASKVTECEKPEFAMGLANRSAVLFHMEKYQECIMDIKESLHHGYPPALTHKLLLREAQCLLHLGQVTEAKKVIQEVLDTTTWPSLSAEKIEKVKNEARALLKKSDLVSSSEKDCSSTLSDQPPPVHGSPNAVIAQATDAIVLENTTDQGRHLLAKKTLEAGDVLIVEEPFAAVLLPPQYSTHCHHCYSKLLTAYPCDHCSVVMFCSEKCKEQAWSVYHCFECPYMDLLHSIGIAHLALRIVLTAGRTYLQDFQQEVVSLQGDTARIPGCTADGRYERNYLTVYELMPHSENMHMDDLFQYTLTGCLLLKLLQNTTFFGPATDSSEGAVSTEVYIGSLLTRHICQLVCNAHAITDVQIISDARERFVDGSEQVRIATAIYPTVSLMNHSCDPSIIPSFCGNILVVRAVKDIEQGEQIYNCYGPHCKRMSYKERQKVLKEQYFFSCKCLACIQHGKDEKRYQALCCPVCTGSLPMSKGNSSVCLDCGEASDTSAALTSVYQAQQHFVQGLKCLQKSNAEGALTEFRTCLKLRDDVLYKHNKQLAECQDVIARCLASLGKFSEAIPYLDASVRTTEVVYGGHSIELANELQKLCEVLFNAHEWDRLSEAAKRAKDVFIKHYGDGHNNVLELTQMEKTVKEMNVK